MKPVIITIKSSSFATSQLDSKGGYYCLLQKMVEGWGQKQSWAEYGNMMHIMQVFQFNIFQYWQQSNVLFNEPVICVQANHVTTSVYSWLILVVRIFIYFKWTTAGKPVPTKYYYLIDHSE